MSLKKYTGGVWNDTEALKRNSGGSWAECEAAKRWNGSAWVPVWENYKYEFKKNESYLSYGDTITSSGGTVQGSGIVRPSTSGGGYTFGFIVRLSPALVLTAQDAVKCDVQLSGKNLLRFKLRAQYGGQPWTDFTFSPDKIDEGSYTGKAVWRTALKTDITWLYFRICIEQFMVGSASGGPVAYMISNMMINGKRCKFEDYKL